MRSALSHLPTTKPKAEPSPLPSRTLVGGLPLLGLLVGLAMTIIGQNTFRGQTLEAGGLMLFLLGIAVFAVAWLRAGLLDLRSEEDPGETQETARSPRPFIGPVALVAVVISVVYGLLAFSTSGDGLFERNNSFYWISGMLFFLGALLEFGGRPGLKGLRDWLLAWRPPRLDNPTRFWPLLALIAIIALGAFFRLYELDDTPSEMISDHAEKALDIETVLNGEFPVFFLRNTGREISQMYVAAGLVKLGMDFDFLVIKLATVLPAILVLPATYMMAREFFSNRKIALLAAVFTAVALWPIISGRVGLRFAYGQLFVALTIAFLLRALKYRQRNDFLLCGLVLGFGMYTYMAFRVMPLVVVACLVLAFAVDLVRRRWRPDLRFAGNSALLGVMALLASAPLVRYAITFRDDYWYRIQTRGAATEVPVSDPVETFFGNLGDAFLMFNWSGDVVWVQNIPHRPGLDYVMGAFLVLGVTILLLRWLRHRDIPTVVLGVAFIALMMPSVLSLAFPDENPAFGRGSGLIPLLFVLVALPVYYVGVEIRRHIPQWWGGAVVLAALAGLIAWVSVINFQAYFDEFDAIYTHAAQNNSEIAAAVQEFADEGPGIESAYIVAHPHWVDTRLLALELADFSWNNVLEEIEDASEHPNIPGPKLYVLHKDADQAVVDWLAAAFPTGLRQLRRSDVAEEKDFALFLTEPTSADLQSCFRASILC